MPAQTYPYLVFNRGLISRFGLGRIDIDRGKLSAEVMTNWMPRVLGSMMLRPGMQFIGTTGASSDKCLLPFVFSATDRAILELGAFRYRVWINDELLTRPTVSSAVANGGFDSNLNSWTDSDEAGATSAWVTGYMGLTGNGTAAAIRDQVVVVAAGDQGVEHALRILVERGPVTIRVGTSSSDDSYIAETELGTGEHSLAFTPTGNFNIRLMSRYNRQVLVNSVAVEASGVVAITAPWASSAMRKVRYDQSGDVVFIAVDGYAPLKIERRSARSWSLVQYLPEDGPFRVMNTGPMTMTPGALTGNTTLTASAPYFKSTHAPSTNNPGALFKVSSQGQTVTAQVVAQNTFTNSIRVTGVGNARVFAIYITISGGAATVTLQRSIDSSSGPWTDVAAYTTTQVTPIQDGLDNQIVWYRMGVKTGDYGAGTHDLTLDMASGSIIGICRVTGYTSTTVVDVEVLSPFGDTGASDSWWEGAWSDRRGWPSSISFHEGRLAFAGKGNIWLSASDAFDSFDEEIEGDSAPISRTIGTGPVDTVNWLISLERLLAGGQGTEWSIRSSSLDEPLTPTNFQIKPTASQGSSSVGAVRIDRRAVFVQRGGTRVFELSMAADASATDYGALDLTQLVPEIGEPSIIKMVVQRQPDTRIHCVRSDGTAAILIFDYTENTICWVEVETGSGPDEIVDVCVLPGTSVEDDVYYVVNREVSGKTQQSLEKWAKESECQGGLLNKQADSFIVHDGGPTTVISGLDHLPGMDVVVWADGEDVGTATSTVDSWTQTYTVVAGTVTLPVAVSKAVVGLPYKAQWKSSKLALSAALGVPITKKKRVHGFGLVTANTHAQGVFFGRDFTHLDPLPLIVEGGPVDPDSVSTDQEYGSTPFPGDWHTDARICLEARAPRPVTIVAAVGDTELHEQR